MPPRHGQLCWPWMLCPLGKLCLWPRGVGLEPPGALLCAGIGRLFQGGKVLPQELLEMLVLSRTGRAWGRFWDPVPLAWHSCYSLSCLGQGLACAGCLGH